MENIIEKEELQKRKENPEVGDIIWGLNFIGIPMASNYYTFHMFSKIFEENPQIEQVIEIGTSRGSMSVALALHAFAKDIPFYTINIQNELSPSTDKILSRLNAQQLIFDVFEKREKIFELLNGKKTLLLCDGGNKVDEMIAFVPQLEEDSIVMAHDYGVEITREPIQKVYNTGRLDRLYEEDWFKTNVQLAIWKIINKKCKAI